MNVVPVMVVAVWAMLPAYVPNNVAVLAGGGKPIDGGRVWKGQRVLGDGKTWRGTGAGILAGVIVAGGLNWIQPVASGLLGVALPTFSGTVAVALAGGAMLGDVLASFLKRRTGRERGAAFPVVDQLDFVVVALLAVFVLAPRWFASLFTPAVIVAVIVLTPALHLLTNGIAYLLGLKDEPW
ncbi:MAG: CDP-2,3-bis-(O-geranylgeranyl)-sn-glycerol synthase [Halanaeroarchaeum sp.]